jgi:hypothetical protein
MKAPLFSKYNFIADIDNKHFISGLSAGDRRPFAFAYAMDWGGRANWRLKQPKWTPFTDGSDRFYPKTDIAV